jgi:Tfp pilus assembly protein PilF
VRLDPNKVTALYRLGQAGAALGLNSDAIKHLRGAVDLDPERSEVALLLATALFANAERQAGSETLERIVQEHEDAYTLLSASVVALKAGELDLARKCLETAVSDNASVPQEALEPARKASAQGDYAGLAFYSDLRRDIRTRSRSGTRRSAMPTINSVKPLMPRRT